LLTGRYETVQTHLFKETDHSIIYIEDGTKPPSKYASLDALADDISNTFDNVIYTRITEVFGEPKRYSSSGVKKIVLLLLDIKDGYEPIVNPGYVGGYFSSNDMLSSGYNSNNAAMLYIDTYPGLLSANFDTSIGVCAHEFQHLINYTYNEFKLPDLWINEGLSTAAEYVYNRKHETTRINSFNSDATIRNGNNFFIWETAVTDPKLLGNYASAYMFFQWLRIHASNGEGIYKEILTSSYSDYRAVTAAAYNRITGLASLGMTGASDWDTLLKTWLIANKVNASSGLYGYKGEIPNITIRSPAQSNAGPFLTNTTISLLPGEAVYSKAGGAGPGDSPPIKYAGIHNGALVNASALVAGDTLLSYNSSVSGSAAYAEIQGSLPSFISASVENAAASAADDPSAAYAVDAWEMLARNRLKYGFDD
jgi:hypothetical protein